MEYKKPSASVQQTLIDTSAMTGQYVASLAIYCHSWLLVILTNRTHFSEPSSQ
ncbi:hypothetical protein GYMLUDRAFT_45141, partial [Collybiopsis luxurians FD-317 M1]